AEHAVVHIAKRSRLLAIAPYLDLVMATEFGSCYFAAQGGRGLFASPLPGTERPEDVVKPHDPGLDPIFLLIVDTEPFGDEFLPPVSVLRLCRICVFFFEWCDISFGLTILWVNTRRRTIKVAFDAIGPGCFESMNINERVVVQDLGMIGGDEHHATHIGTQGIDFIDSVGRLQAILPSALVKLQKLVSTTRLIFRRFQIGPSHPVALPLQVLNQMMADEATGSSYKCFCHHSSKYGTCWLEQYARMG